MKVVGMRSLWLTIGALLIAAAWFNSSTRAAEVPSPRLALTPGTEQPTNTAVVGPSNTPQAPTNTPDLPPRETVEPPVTLTPEPTKPDDDDDDPPDPAVIKRADRSSVRPGDTLVFTLEITNRGESTARQVVVVDSVPDAFEVLDVTAERGEVTRSGQEVTVTIDELRPGDVVIVQIQTRVRGGAESASRENRVTLTSANSDSDLSNNTSNVSVQVEGPTLTPDVTATPAVSTTATLAATPAVTPTAAAPTPTPAKPVRLPNTSTGGWDASSAALLLLGLIVLGVGVALRRRAA